MTGAHRTTNVVLRFLIAGAAATVLTACDSLPTVSNEAAIVDVGAIADMPVDAAANFLNQYRIPAAARRSTTATILQNFEKYQKNRCRFGATSTELPQTKATLSNSTLRYIVKRITVNEFLIKQGLQNGVGIRVEPLGMDAESRALNQCALAWFPENFPGVDLTREINRLATALTAIGIQRGE
ncbi:MAG: hypothetical protein K9J42_15755 [Sulfuritalea sp.]|nr:hypothetical protein [Sulfuritalea sp.]